MGRLQLVVDVFRSHLGLALVETIAVDWVFGLLAGICRNSG